MAISTQLPSRLFQLLQVLHEGVYITDTDRRIVYWNKAAEGITGYSAEFVVGRRCQDDILRHVSEDGRSLCTTACPLHATLADAQPRDLVAYLHHRNGKRLPVHIRSLLYKENDSQALLIEVFDEISERRELLHELEMLRNEILVDALTGAGNRRYYELVAESRIAAFQVHKIPFGFLIFDIDRFKNVNDTFGHLVGDQVIKMVAETIMQAVRSLDTVIRYGGDEFVILVPNCTVEYLLNIAERIRALVESSWLDLENNRQLKITISGGASLVREHDTIAMLASRADRGLYASKMGGTNRVTLLDSL